MKPRLIKKQVALKDISVFELIKLWLSRKVGYYVKQDPNVRELRDGNHPDNRFVLGLVVDGVLHEIITAQPRFAAILSKKPDLVNITGWPDRPRLGMHYDGVGFKTTQDEEETNG